MGEGQGSVSRRAWPVLLAVAAGLAALTAGEWACRPATPASPYAGSASCRSCHAANYAAWSRSHHAHAQDPPETLASAFATTPGGRTEGRPAVTAPGEDGRPRVHRVDALIGVDPLVQ